MTEDILALLRLLFWTIFPCCHSSGLYLYRMHYIVNYDFCTALIKVFVQIFISFTFYFNFFSHKMIIFRVLSAKYNYSEFCYYDFCSLEKCSHFLHLFCALVASIHTSVQVTGVIPKSLPVLSTESVLRKAAVDWGLRLSTEQNGYRQRNDFIKCTESVFF